MPVLTPGPTTRIGACAQRTASRSHSRTSAGTVDERQMPSTVVEVEHAAEEDAELVAGAGALGRETPVVREPVAIVEAEDGLGVADIDGEQHRLIVGARPAARRPWRRQPSLESFPVVRQWLADPLGERLGGELRLVAFARSSSTVMSPDIYTSARGIIRVGRFLSHTQTSSICRWKNG